MTARYPIVAILVAAAAGICASDARADSKREITGKATAEMVCARCHEIGTKQIPGRRIGDGTPPAFLMIAQDPKMTPEALRRYIRFPHGAMDTIFITKRETDALLTYILSLKPVTPGQEQAR